MIDKASTDSVFHSRAIPSSSNLENDPDVMVHQQLARLYFFEKLVGTAGKSVLDFGCGSGFNCHIIAKHAKVSGFDFSANAVALASAKFPDCDFVVADGCSPTLDLGQFERIICCEVLEHVSEMTQFLGNIKQHLTSDGIAFITTPNVAVFSNGHRPSPLNREHIHELTLIEFQELLGAFNEVCIFGQKFKSAQLTEDWNRDVQKKIEMLQNGTRWREPNSSEDSLLHAIHRIPPIRWLWTQLRWRIVESILVRRAARRRPYSFRDFEFVENDLSDAIWFCAIVRA